jgi:hypothetical protein
MKTLSPITYETFRLQDGVRSLRLEEGPEKRPPEKLLQAIWYHQRVFREALATVEGLKVRVLHPGFWNHGGGPDFQNAVIQIGQEAPLSGDVEIDLTTQGWVQHGHAKNNAFSKVILHVVWDEPTAPQRDLPTLCLRPFLDSSLEELDLSLGLGADDWPMSLFGQCCGPLQDLAEDKAVKLLQQAAWSRFLSKSEELKIKSRQVGVEQALFEALFRALGYKQNIWPMQRLGELVPLIAQVKPNLLTWQALLLGVAGLLPSQLPGDCTSNVYLRSLWDIWWREREVFRQHILPSQVWEFYGLRPANYPQRRLALAAHWLHRGSFVEQLQDWVLQAKPGPASLRTLSEVLSPHRDGFWSHHLTFRSIPRKLPIELIGPARVTDLAVNVILPWFHMRAEAGGNKELQKTIANLYFSWPKGEDNALLRKARMRLWGTRAVNFPASAATQQGVIQIVRDFCEHSNALCEKCPFPGKVREWLASLEGED